MPDPAELNLYPHKSQLFFRFDREEISFSRSFPETGVRLLPAGPQILSLALAVYLDEWDARGFERETFYEKSFQVPGCSLKTRTAGVLLDCLVETGVLTSEEAAPFYEMLP